MVNLYQRSWKDYLAGNWTVAPEFKSMKVRNLPDNNTRMSIDKWKSTGGRATFDFKSNLAQVEGQYQFYDDPDANATILPFSLNLRIGQGNVAAGVCASSPYAKFDASLSGYGDTLFAQGQGGMFLIPANMASGVKAGLARMKHVTITIVYVDVNRFVVNVYYLYRTPEKDPEIYNSIRLWHERVGAGRTTRDEATQDASQDSGSYFSGTPVLTPEAQAELLQVALAEFEVGLERIEFLMLGIPCSVQAKGPLSAKLAELHDVYCNIGGHIK